MIVDDFLDNFSVIARSRNGVGLLRDLISHLAITGGLSRQEPGDSDASKIRQDSLAAKEAYLQENSVRQSKRKNAELSQRALSIPDHWASIPAGDLVHLINGRAFKSSEWRTSGLPIIRIQNLNDPNAKFNYYQGEVLEKHCVHDGDMLLSWSGTPGTSFGAFIWDGGDAVLNQHIFKVEIFSELIDKEYLRLAINACLDALISSARGGVGLKHVTKGQIEALQVPIPPCEEQVRVVQKYFELAELCHTLTTLRSTCDELRPSLSEASHRRFLESRAESTLGALFFEPGFVSPSDLQTTCLTLAITGGLSRQEPGDSDASKIRQDSLAAKEAYLQENSVRQSKRKNAELSQRALSIPDHWASIPAGDLVHLINGRAFKSSEWRTSGLPIIRIQNLNDPNAKFNYYQGEVLEKHCVHDGDMLLSWSGTPGTSFGAFIWDGGDAVLNQHIFKVEIFSELIDKEYLRLAINACLDALISSARGGVGLKHVTKGQIEALQVPIPPCEEQVRVVQKYFELAELCHTLAGQHHAIYSTSDLYAEVVVSTLTGIQKSGVHGMKVPEAELVSRLVCVKGDYVDADAPLATLLAASNEDLSARMLWQQSGLGIDAFYHQLKCEMTKGWIIEPEKAYVNEKEAS